MVLVKKINKWFPGKVIQLERTRGLAGDTAAAAAAKSLQSCLTLCDPIDGSPPGSPVPGILQARTLEWVAISFSNAGKWRVRVKLLSRVRLFETPWTAAYQGPPPLGFSRQEYCSGVPLPSPLETLPVSKTMELVLALQSAKHQKYLGQAAALLSEGAHCNTNHSPLRHPLHPAGKKT